MLIHEQPSFGKEANLSPHLGLVSLASILVSSLIFILKYYAYYKTQSIAFYSDAIESIVNIIISAIAWLAILISMRPADTNHPFGHNKAEYFSAAFEGSLIFIAALIIIKKAILGLSLQHESIKFNNGFIISSLAAILQGLWGGLLWQQAKKYNAIALKADALHMLSDVGTTIAVIVGVMVSYISSYYFLDPIIAIAIAANILWQGYKIIKNSVQGLMDHCVDDTTYQRIKEIISNNSAGAIEAHELKTRTAGSIIFIEFHLVVAAAMRVNTAHNICDTIEMALKKDFPTARVLIHIEPEEEAQCHSTSGS